MPHRITTFSNSCLWAIDGVALGFATMIAFIEGLTLDKLTGPNGFLIASIGVCWVLWKNGQSRDKLLGKNHDEMIQMQMQANEKLAALTAESIKASFIIANEMKDLRKELEKRVCFASPPLKK